MTSWRIIEGDCLSSMAAQLARHRIVDDAPLLNSVIEDAA